MNKAVLYFVLLFVIFRPGIIAQDFLDTVSYIPMVGIGWYDATLNNCEDCAARVTATPLLKQMGLDAMVVQNLDRE